MKKKVLFIMVIIMLFCIKFVGAEKVTIKNDNDEVIDENKTEVNYEIDGKDEKNIVNNIKTIENGEYKIRIEEDDNKIFDIKGGSNESRAKLQIWNDCNVKQQRYIVNYIGDGYYKITARNSNKVLDVENGGLYEGTKVQQYDWNNTDAQKWIIKKNEDDTYSIISKCNGLYITVPNSNTACGTELLLNKEKNDKSQRLKFEKVNEEIGKKTIEDGTYEIKSVMNNNKVFDIVSGSTESGAKLQMWEDANVPQQRFNIKYIENGLYSLTVKRSGKVLDVVNGVMENGNRIQQYDWNNTDAQKWIIRETENGRYNIISRGTGLYLTVENGEVKNGTKVSTYGKSNKSNQEFVFEKIKIEKGVQSIDDDDYEIRTATDDEKIFDIEGGSSQSKAKLQIWNDCDVLQQRYNIKYIGNGYYKIIAKISNKVLDVENGGLYEGTKVQQYDWNNTDAQKWIIKKNEDSTYSIISKCNNLALTIEGNDVTCGTKIVLCESNDNNLKQKFIFDKVVKENRTKTIENGEYKIRIEEDNNKIFDIKGGSNELRAKLQIWNDCNVKQQRYIVNYIGDGYYKITARNSNKVLDVENGGLYEGTKVQQYDWNNTDAQKWIIKKNEDDTYSIISKCNGLYITVPNSNTACGTELLLNKEKNDKSQRLKFEKVNEEIGKKTIEDGTYEIKSVMNNNKVFDIVSGSTESGAKLQMWEDANVPQQRFNIKYIENGLYSLTVKRSGKVLDVVNGVMENGNRIQQYDWNNTDAQKWIIRETENGRYNIISRGTGLYLTVENGEVKNGTKVSTYGKSNKSNQEFIFEKITELNGIDVSSYQNNIDWKQVKESGIDFAMIRVGYRGWGTGKIVYDNSYSYNLENALKNNIKCGVYFYSQAVNESEAIEEADFVINAIKNYNITYPIVIDSEYATTSRVGRADNLSTEERTKVCKAFCERVQQKGYSGMIYASKFWFYNNLDMSKLSNYKVWVAHYTNSINNKTDYKGKYDIWQYTSKGNIAGINGNVDLNMIFQ